MRKEEEIQRMLAGKLFSPAGLGRDEWKRVHAAQKAFNDADDSTLRDDCQAMTALKKCFGAAPDDLKLTPPVYFDQGVHVFFGEHFYANTDLTILDEMKSASGITSCSGPTSASTR